MFWRCVVTAVKTKKPRNKPCLGGVIAGERMKLGDRSSVFYLGRTKDVVLKRMKRSNFGRVEGDITWLGVLVDGGIKKGRIEMGYIVDNENA